MICPNCGAEMPDYANFCTKCGSKLASPDPKTMQSEKNEQSEPPQQPVSSEQPKQETPQIEQEQTPQETASKSNDVNKFFAFLAERFMVLYVIFGVVAVVLTEFSALFTGTWVGITLGVLSIICALVFLLLGIYRFVALKPKTGKRSNADIICFALGIILFLFVLITSWMVMAIGEYLNDIIYK